jgi:hypothetical protein
MVWGYCGDVKSRFLLDHDLTKNIIVPGELRFFQADFMSVD